MQDLWGKRKQGSPARRSLQVEQPQARPTGFHETRDTETRSFFAVGAQGTHNQEPPPGLPPPPPGRCFPARCGAASCGYGAAWEVAVPRAGNTACWVFTSHESRNMFFNCPPATPRRATPSPANGFSRNTRHETRITAFMLFFPRFPGISRYSSVPPLPPEPVSARRQPQLSPPSGLLPLRRKKNEPC